MLTAADGQYAVGTFDGTTFTAEATRLPGHRGRGFYAAQTFSDIPKSDGRRIQIGWLQTPTVGMPFNQAMTVPLELQLITTPDGPRLRTTPVRELKNLRSSSQTWTSLKLVPGGKNPIEGLGTELIEVQAEFRPGKNTVATFQIRGGLIQYDVAKQELDVNGHRVSVPLQDGKMDLTILCDRTCFEIFAGNGLVYVPMPFQPKADDVSLILNVSGDAVDFERLEVHSLKSAWNTPTP